MQYVNITFDLCSYLVHIMLKPNDNGRPKLWFMGQLIDAKHSLYVVSSGAAIELYRRRLPRDRRRLPRVGSLSILNFFPPLRPAMTRDWPDGVVYV